jgi:hypothetical protein
MFTEALCLLDSLIGTSEALLLLLASGEQGFQSFAAVIRGKFFIFNFLLKLNLEVSTRHYVALAKAPTV